MTRITVTIVWPTYGTSEDAHGNPVPSDPERIPVRRRGKLPAFAPRGSDEPFSEGGRRILTQGALYLPPGTDVRPTDRFEIDGDDGWNVDGAAGNWSNAHTGRAHGIEVAVTKGA